MIDLKSVNSSSLLYYLVYILLAWIISWYAIYSITGFHLSSISINNGISFNGVTFKSKRMWVKIRCLRFRLWGNTKMTIIDDLEVKLYPKSHPKKQKKNTSIARDDYESDSLENDISVYPNNYFLRRIVQFVIRRLPSLDLEMRNTTIHSALDYKTTIDYVKYNAKSRDSLRHKDRLKFRTSLLVNNVFHEIKTKDDLLTPFKLGSFRVEFKFLIGYKSGVIGGSLERLMFLKVIS